MSKKSAGTILAVALALAFAGAVAIPVYAQQTTRVNGKLYFRGVADTSGAVFVLSAQQYSQFSSCVQHTDAADCLNGNYTYRTDVSYNDGSFEFGYIPQGAWTFVGLDDVKSNNEYGAIEEYCGGGVLNGVQLYIQ